MSDITAVFYSVKHLLIRKGEHANLLLSRPGTLTVINLPGIIQEGWLLLNLSEVMNCWDIPHFGAQQRSLMNILITSR
jgi:hypothetical protein